MSRYTVAVCTLLVAAACCVSLAQGRVQHWDDDDSSGGSCGTFDFFVFTRQWPASNGCTNNCQNAFTIHGMWPSNFQGSDPADCGAKFDSRDLDPILSTLQKEWPSYQGDDDSFWSHEYEKHGSCACSVAACKTEFDFFNTTLAYHAKYNLMDALEKASIKPGGSVSVSAVTQAVESFFGPNAGATVQCSNGQLESIEMCLDKTFTPIACPSADMQGTCTESTVQWPTQ